MTKTIDVLLATCNGEAFVGQLLESLLAQTHPHFRVWVRDDASDDTTRDILATYLPRFDGRLILVEDGLGRQGVLRNFEQLLAHAMNHGESTWFAFADQDDVWMPQKLARFDLEAVKLDAHAEQQPCLVYSDLVVVNRSLDVVASSFWRYEGIKQGDERLSLLLSRNVVTGCASMVNRRLAEIALPFPDAVLMHDWWCALIAGFGQIRRIDIPLVLYRQHGGNTIGARRGGVLGMLFRSGGSVQSAARRVRSLGERSVVQAERAFERMRLHGFDVDIIGRYLVYRDSSLPHRLRSAPLFYRWSRVDDWIKLLFWMRRGTR